jgi:hypothetical protein
MNEKIMFEYSKMPNKARKLVTQRANLKRLLESYQCENEDIHHDVWKLFIELLYVSARTHDETSVTIYEATEDNVRATSILEKVGVCTKAHGDLTNVYTINYH